jgi:GAF domain-containing protein
VPIPPVETLEDRDNARFVPLANYRVASVGRALEGRPIVAIPMLARDQLVGFFIVLWCAQPRRLSPRVVRALEGISRVVTVTIDHARLYNEAERRRREAEILTGVVHAINELKRDIDAALARGAGRIIFDIPLIRHRTSW